MIWRTVVGIMVCVVCSSPAIREAAAQVCSDLVGEEMDDVALVRACFREHDRSAWPAPLGFSMLHRAANYSNTPAVVRIILEAGFDPNARANNSWTPLLIAAARDNPTIVSVLIDGGGDLDLSLDDGQTPLHLAARRGATRIVTLLLEAGAEPSARESTSGYSPLHFAAAGSDPRTVASLLEFGADPKARATDGRTPLHSAVLYSDAPEVVRVLLESGAAEALSAMHSAALAGDRMSVSNLLRQAADPNAVDHYGWTPLHFATFSNDGSVVRTLLAAGADPDLADAAGNTALHLARLHDPIAVLALLDGGADPNAKDGDGHTPLVHYLYDDAIRADPASAAILALLKAGANPNTAGTDNEGNTALHLAALAVQNPIVIEELLGAGADSMAVNLNGLRWVELLEHNPVLRDVDPYRRMVRQVQAARAAEAAERRRAMERANQLAEARGKLESALARYGGGVSMVAGLGFAVGGGTAAYYFLKSQSDLGEYETHVGVSVLVGAGGTLLFISGLMKRSEKSRAIASARERVASLIGRADFALVPTAVPPSAIGIAFSWRP